jgi:hypothetical protein
MAVDIALAMPLWVTSSSSHEPGVPMTAKVPFRYGTTQIHLPGQHSSNPTLQIQIPKRFVARQHGVPFDPSKPCDEFCPSSLCDWESYEPPRWNQRNKKRMMKKKQQQKLCCESYHLPKRSIVPG